MKKYFQRKYTVKLGYNNRGYSKYTVITNKPRRLVWHILSIKFHAYSEQKT